MRYSLDDPEGRANFVYDVEAWGATCYWVAREPLTVQRLREYEEVFFESQEVEDTEEAREFFRGVFEIGWKIERENLEEEYWEEHGDQRLPTTDPPGRRRDHRRRAR